MSTEERNVEVELRAELSGSTFSRIHKDFSSQFKQTEDKKRLSVLFMGAVEDIPFDIRVRTEGSGYSELVVKRGAFHGYDRLEFSQEISKDQIIGLAKVFSTFPFESKVIERVTCRFNLEDGIELSLVKAKDIYYLEIEKLTTSKKVKETRELLASKCSALGVDVIKNESEFNELCNRLTKECDWTFDGSNASLEKLKKQLADY